MKTIVYLADQNPHRDRSLGISNMTECLLTALSKNRRLELHCLTSRSSVRSPDSIHETVLPWRTDRMFNRLLTDHLHALASTDADIFYYPKGYIGLLRPPFGKTVVTIHDTIIQHYADHYPEERSKFNYGYWIELTKHTIRKADHILTVSQNSKNQILSFCDRYNLIPPPIEVTFEATSYEEYFGQPVPKKEDHVVMLASKAPHKRVIETLGTWCRLGDQLPELHLIGNPPDEALQSVLCSNNIKHSSFLPKNEFVEAVQKARALVFPSEIEGFGLPAIESYFLGTPACVARGTAMDEILEVATPRGRFDPGDDDSFESALNEVLAMSSDEVCAAGDQLRNSYSREQFANSVTDAFECALAR